MNEFICPNCSLPFTAVPANCFEGNALECPHCRRKATVIFKGRITEGGRAIVGGTRFLITSKPTERKG